MRKDRWIDRADAVCRKAEGRRVKVCDAAFARRRGRGRHAWAGAEREAARGVAGVLREDRGDQLRRSWRRSEGLQAAGDGEVGGARSDRGAGSRRRRSSRVRSRLLKENVNNADAATGAAGVGPEHYAVGGGGQRCMGCSIAPRSTRRGSCRSHRPGRIASTTRMGPQDEVPCDGPHDAEVFAELNEIAPPDTPYPGEDGVGALADRAVRTRVHSPSSGSPSRTRCSTTRRSSPTTSSGTRATTRPSAYIISRDGQQLTGSARARRTTDRARHRFGLFGTLRSPVVASTCREAARASGGAGEAEGEVAGGVGPPVGHGEAGGGELGLDAARGGTWR